MKGVDTNILVRYFTQDDSIQLEQASQLFKLVKQDGGNLLINNMVLCELVWTLESRYSYKKIGLIVALELLLDTDIFEFENRERIKQALDDYKNSNVGFADCLINRTNQILGCTETYTFDKKAAKLSGFTVYP